MKAKPLLLFITFFIIFFASTAFASTQKFEANGSYRMGENDTIASAKEEAKNAALRQAAEYAGVYIRSYSETHNSMLTDDEIKVVAAKVMKVKSVEYSQEYVENTLHIHAHIVAVVDDKELSSEKEKEILDLKEKLKAEQAQNKDIKNAQIKHGAKDMETEREIVINTARLKIGEYHAAVLGLTTHITAKSEIVPARMWYLRSVAYFNLERYNEALDDIRRAILDGQNPLYYVQEGMIRFAVSKLYVGWRQYGEAQNQYLLAEQNANTAMSFKKNYFIAYYCRSLSYYLNSNIKNNLKKAMKDAERAVNNGGKGVSFIEHYDDYIHAQYNGRKEYLPHAPLIPMLTEGVNGMLEFSDEKKKE